MRKLVATFFAGLVNRYGRIAVYGGAALIVVVLGWMFLRGDGAKEETMVAQPGEFLQQVSVSGKVVAADKVDLAFNDTGRVAWVGVKVGDKVALGQALAGLTLGTLVADLRAAEADVALRRAEIQNTATNLENVRNTQNTLVASAYSKLLSSGLVAVPASSAYSADTPTITGLYNGPEGTYKMRIVHGSQSGVNDHRLNTFDLERTGPIEILDDEPTALGTHGLFTSFPSTLNEYDDTIWYVTIPNTKSSSYLANYNAYQEALRTRDREISSAQAELGQNTGETTVSEAEIEHAEAEVARIRSMIADRTLRAPFAGIVTAVMAKVGASTPQEAAVSLISADTLQIESYVPEINLSLLAVGDMAEVTLDAYGEGTPFNARVVSIDPAETVRDGVSTYRAVLQFLKQDERVRAGMTANVVITTETKQNVISVPQGIVVNRSGKKFVSVKEGEKTVEREVTTGSISSLGSIEIISGLSASDVVVLTPGN